MLRASLGRWPGDAGLAEVEALVRGAHADAVAGFEDVEVVGFHGQTLAHEPQGRGTHQVGRGDWLARDTGRAVVWDFRTADVGSGGEGAPLVPFFHFALARRIGAEAPVAFLNLGGVGNVTWVDPRADGARGAGGARRLRHRAGECADRRLPRGAAGTGLRRRRARWRRRDGCGTRSWPGSTRHPYLARTPPKSLDRQDFHGFLDRVAPLSTEDGAATLAALTVACVAEAARHFPEPATRWLVCGGGRKNRTLMAMLAARSNAPVEPVEAVGFDGDMLEAQAFAYLAVRVLRGLPTSAPGTTGVRLPVSGGRVSRP